MKYTKLIFSALFLLAGLTAYSQPAFDGFALYNDQNSNTAYLIDEGGNIAHTWNCNTACNYTVQLKDDGNIIRGGVKSGGNQINGAAVGGVVQEYDPQGNMIWEFEYSTSDHVSHHDITLMPNGGVMLIAWEVKNSSELTAAGFTGNQTVRYPTHFVEVQPDGNGGGQIVWEWHMWDHMIQDTDQNKPNYGVISDHPELMDINVATSGGMGPGGGGGDWFHVNGVDYNPTLDQIAFTSRYLSELFIIDHSTTTQEAAGHTGGNSGMGGDFLYRWGKPANYGTTGNQTIPGPCHDVRWIKDGRPNAGYLQFFNNDGNTNGSSTVDAINPPVNGYNYDRTAGQAYGPTTYDWRHVTLADGSGQSASDRMPNGNTFVAVSREYMYEVDTNNTVVWQYNANPPKGFRYTCDHPGIIAVLGANPCNLSTIEAGDLRYMNIYPNPSNGQFKLDGLPLDGRRLDIQVRDLTGKEVATFRNTDTIDLNGQEAGLYIARISLETGETLVRKLILTK